MTQLPANVRPAFERSPDYVQSLHRGLDVICAFDREQPAMTLSALAGRTGLSRAVVRRVLLTLEYLGYIARPDGQQGRLFALAPRILDLGFGYLSTTIAKVALPFMEELARGINESCSLTVLDGHDIVYVQRVSVRRVMTISLAIGARLPAFCASMGRVLVAGLDEEARARWLRELKPRALTRFTLTDKAALQKELQRVCAQGYAYVEQELEEGLCAIAVPVGNGNGLTVAALNSGMAYRAGARARAIKQVLPALQNTARQIERSLPAAWNEGGTGE
jgi:IclR family transcriptional regulator, pca regulon regulatory protein